MPDQRDKSKVGLTIYIYRDLREAANARAKEKDETVTDVIRRALKEYVR